MFYTNLKKCYKQTMYLENMHFTTKVNVQYIILTNSIQVVYTIGLISIINTPITQNNNYCKQ